MRINQLKHYNLTWVYLVMVMATSYSVRSLDFTIAVRCARIVSKMAKKIEKKIKLQIPAGKATPAPPVGTALGPAGINIGDFVNKFNLATKDLEGDIIPVEIAVYADRSFDFVLKTPPAASLILKAIGVEKGSSKSLVSKAGKITQSQIKAIAEKKLPDLNTTDLEAAMRSIAGTARSMGVEVVG